MKNSKTVIVPLFAALTAAGAFIKLPLYPVAVTFQSFFVILSGVLLGSSYGAMSQMIYIIVGLSGFPVFSGGGGISYLFMPSFGYLLGFIASPIVTGFIAGEGKITFLRALFASIGGTAAIYFIGLPYLYAYLFFILHKPEAFNIALTTGLLVFLPGDILKCFLVAIVAAKFKDFRMRRVDKA